MDCALSVDPTVTSERFTSALIHDLCTNMAVLKGVEASKHRRSTVDKFDQALCLQSSRCHKKTTLGIQQVPIVHHFDAGA